MRVYACYVDFVSVTSAASTKLDLGQLELDLSQQPKLLEHIQYYCLSFCLGLHIEIFGFFYFSFGTLFCYFGVKGIFGIISFFWDKIILF